MFLLGGPLALQAQDLPEYDEISVFLEIPRTGGTDIDALIKGQELYLPVTALFDFLKIRNIPSPDLETISGFFITPEASYIIDRQKNRIIYQDRTFDLVPGDLIKTESSMYMRSSLYGKIFGLDCVFNFRSLSVTVNTKLELPLIREMRLEEMRKNLTRLKGEIKADTTIGRSYPLFRFGMADWSAIASEEINGRSDMMLNLSLGAMLAGGEATANLYYNSTDPVSEKQQFYLWRYVNNDFAPLRQVMAGKITTNAISSIFNPVIGVQITNTPTTFRRSFGTYTLSDRTDPGWIVELYVNNVLVDYVKADASGFYTFEVPLVYGNSIIKVKFFGPWGEERTREQYITIPFNFLPSGTMEYAIGAGIVEDTVRSRFSRASINYGLSKAITVGGGVEYLSSISSRPAMPYINASFRLANNLMLSGEYDYGVRAKGTLSYRLPSNLQLDLNYTWYNKEQKAIFYNYREERRATISMPLKLGKFASFQRLSLYQIVLPGSKYTTGEWLISGSVFGVNTNLTTYALLIDRVKPYFYSNLSMSFRLPAGFILMPQAQYGYTENKLFSAKARLERRVLEHGFISLSYEQNFRNNLKFAEAGFRYDFRFAQTGASVRQSNNRTSFIQYARGSLINDRKTRYLGTDNRPNVGRGGISIVAFLDLNGSGTRDAGEPRAYGLNIRSSSGRIERSDRDTTIRILGLEPYTNCFIELDPNSFENISWRLGVLTYSVAVDPDILKLVEIPVTIAGEANGSVILESNGERKGLGRVIVNFRTTGDKPAGKTLTEADGYFSYFGFHPGDYRVSIDTSQLAKLRLVSEPESVSFSITGGIEGDIVDGLDFVLKPLPEEAKTTPSVIQDTALVRKDTSVMVIHELSEEVYTITEDSWAIQIGAFKQRSLAEGFRDRLEAELGKKVEITVAGEYFRVRILDLKTRQEVDENVVKLNRIGFRELWIIRLLARQRQILLISHEDSLARATKSFIPGEVPLTQPEMATIQLGAFRLKSNAISLRERLASTFGKKITIVNEGGYYKVRLTQVPLIDQTVLEAMKDLMPSFGKLGISEVWIPPALIPIVPERPVTIPEQVERLQAWRSEIPPDIQPGINLKGTKKGLVVRGAQAEPTIALQVGVFHEYSKALRAQRKITTKLDLPVEIVQQWDYYHVIVTGFYTREQTFRYYPELAGLGYPGVTIIENYKRQK
ncbi:MAG: SPOR domain-containing protein [Bacteroidales bacterium]